MCTETKGKASEVLVAHSMFDLEIFKMKDGVLMFTKAANKNQIGEVWQIYLPESLETEVLSLCIRAIWEDMGVLKEC